MSTQKHIEILAKSSSSDTPYTVRCYLEENKTSFFCSCPAGDNRKLCKHVRKIIAGDDSILYDSKQKELLVKIVSRLQNTDIPFLLSQLNESEILLENAKKNVKKAKKTLEKVILQK